MIEKYRDSKSELDKQIYRTYLKDRDQDKWFTKNNMLLWFF